MSSLRPSYSQRVQAEKVQGRDFRSCERACLLRALQVDIVEFSPEDATRTELDFLFQVVQTAVDAGATYINIPDTVGFTTPEEFANIFDYLVANVTSDHKVVFGVHCHDDLGMATANTLTAIKHGAGRVQGTINGIGERAGNVALEEVAVALEIRQDYYQVETDIVLNETITLQSWYPASQVFQCLRTRRSLVAMPSLMNLVSIRMAFLNPLTL